MQEVYSISYIHNLQDVSYLHSATTLYKAVLYRPYIETAQLLKSFDSADHNHLHGKQ